MSSHLGPLVWFLVFQKGCLSQLDFQYVNHQVVSLNVSFSWLRVGGHSDLPWDHTVPFIRKEGKKKKVLLRTLKLTKEFANSMYQGSTEIFISIKKKPPMFIAINERKKSFKKGRIWCFLITNLFPFSVLFRWHCVLHSFYFPSWESAYETFFL